ncbi:hypothetical protein [Amycolatopsis alkalitolerans]|uniref:Uncharacterized protein n=1 Tax=Amycolatopsis alkalitolerans TaxID=2547244 RepID=A0A5C4LZ70_9PSEU|nr:hypothetical protein [Amycolatopsis alkalitolerans]TNC25094.1 hypothetical protein FG385_15720 [Amycolatopsis alkalitolerans]
MTTVKVFSFWVPNPYGVCTVVRVAVAASSRAEAVQRIKRHGLRIKPRQEQDPGLTPDEREFVESNPDAVWVIDTGELDGKWMRIEEFPFEKLEK